MSQRHTLTDKEHIKLVEVGDKFWEELGKLTAKAVNKMPKDLEDLTVRYLQDKASLYGTRYYDHLNESRK